MLYISLVVSALLLIAVNCCARGRYPVAGTVGASVVAAVLPMCITLALPAVWLQAALLAVALFVLLVPNRGRRLYLPASVVASLMAYGVIAWSVADRQGQLREKFPIESIADRLPPRSATGKPSPANPDRLEYIENRLEQQDSLSHYRQRALQRLHADRVDHLVLQP